jgi:hypothetical protein
VVKRVPSPGRRLPVPVTGDGTLTRDGAKGRSETAAFRTLNAIATDPEASDTAKVSASRTLLEAAGRIGAGRQALEGDTVFSVATRAALEAELTRLRSACYGAKRNASSPKP